MKEPSCQRYEECRRKTLVFETQRNLLSGKLTNVEIAICSNCGQVYRDNGNSGITVFDGRSLSLYLNWRKYQVVNSCS